MDYTLHAFWVQDVRLNLREVRAQSVHAARAIAFRCCARLVAHDLRDGTGRGSSSFAKRRKRAAQAVDSQPLDSGLVQCLPVA